MVSQSPHSHHDSADVSHSPRTHGAPPLQEASPAHAHDAHSVLRQVVQAARALAGADAAAILLYERASARFVPVVPSVAIGLDESWLRRKGLPAAQSLALEAVQAREVLTVRDTATAPELEFPLLVGGVRPGAVTAAPLLIEGAAVGVLGLYHAQPLPAPIDAATLRPFAALAGLAIDVARAHDREASLLARLEALAAAATALAADLSGETVLQRIVDAATRIAGARYGALGVAGPDGYLTAFITTGISPEERARIGPLPRGHGLLGVLIREGQPLRVPDIRSDPRRVGFPSHHPPMTSLLGVPIRVHNAVIGDLYLTDKIGAPEFSEDDQHIIELLAAHAGVAIENARLYAQVGELTLLRERERIGRELHDGIIQNIYAATLHLEDLAEELPEGAARERALGVADQLSAVITDVRTYIQGLRPRELAGRLLSEGLAALVEEVGTRQGLAASYAVEGEAYRLPDTLANALLQSTREALANVVKHAEATQVQVRLAYTPSAVRLTVSDDGCGFDPAAARGEAHRGLRNLQARAAELGGTVHIESTPGAEMGTTLSIHIPTNA